MLSVQIDPSDKSVTVAFTHQFYFFVVNGIVATTVHYVVFISNLFIFEISSYGVSNLIASIFGIIPSFLGNRYFVFKSGDKKIINQIAKFGIVYLIVVALNGLMLYIWSDRLGLNYHLGFALAVAIQVPLSYLGNKFIVFKKVGNYENCH